MPSRDPVKPDGPRKHVGKHAAKRASKDALTLAEAEAKAAEAAAELARARAELLKAQQDSEPETTAAVELDTAQVVETTEAAEPAPDVDEAGDGRAAGQSAARPRKLTGIRKVLPWAAATLAVLTIGGLIAADVVMLAHHNNVALRQRQSAEYATAARQGVVTLMSLNYETVDDNVKAILDNSTGEFKKDFEDHAGDFTKVARQSKTVTTVDTAVAGVESMSDDDAVVLVAANTKVTNTAGAKEEPRSWRLTVHLAREGDRIKMSKVDFAA